MCISIYPVRSSTSIFHVRVCVSLIVFLSVVVVMSQSQRGSVKQSPLGNPVASSPSIAGNMDAGVLENSIVQQWPTVKGSIGIFDRLKKPANKSDPSSTSPTASLSPTTQAATRKSQEEKEQFATLTLPDGRSFKLPYMRGTDGPDAIDIRKLYDQAEVFTYDPGFTSTCSCYSAITFIDGPKGILLHRGYDIIDLVNHSDYTEVCYLLMYGELPTPRQKELHDKDLKYHRMIHEKLITFYKGFKSDAHPMAIMVGVVGALSAFYHDSLDVTNPLDRARSAYRLIAKMPTIAAIAYKTSIGQPIVYPRDDLTYAENFLYMLFALPTKPYVLQPAVVRAIEIFLILHADHEQNASTSTVRIAGSSHANPFACVASGIAALWGPAHGGANEAVINMLIEIGTVENIPAFIARCKDKNDTTRLMGFGHRVYKNFDPRARRMRQVCYDVLEALGIKDDPLLALAVELEKIALNDEYFVKRKLYPNVDFYSGIILRAIGIPVSMFTVLFAVARTAGWISQWKEMIENPDQKIGRPRQLYVGATARPYVSIDARDEVIPDDQQLKPPPKGKIVSVHYQSGGES